MTTSTATHAIDDGFSGEEIVGLTLGSGQSHAAHSYLRGIGSSSTGTTAHTWTAGANLAQWGAFKDGEYPGRDIVYLLRDHENAVILDRGVTYTQNYPIGITPDRSVALAQRFDY